MKSSYEQVISLAWHEYNSSREIESIEDISAKVSTNHVFRIRFKIHGYIIAKISYFGKHEHFVQDHEIVNILANNLLYPFDHFIARSLCKGKNIFIYESKIDKQDMWVVFYNPIRLDSFFPNKLSKKQILTLAQQLGMFHKSCFEVRNELPKSTITMSSDIQNFLGKLIIADTYSEEEKDIIITQCRKFMRNTSALGLETLDFIPVFIDWNTGNFSVDRNGNFFSRWDYDWFRVSTRVMDFYFMSRVVRQEGDQTNFSYTINPLLEERFILFLKEYHRIFPLKDNELLSIKECYRFFILQYVINLGHYFFLPKFANRLKAEALETYFSDIENIKNDYWLKQIKS